MIIGVTDCSKYVRYAEWIGVGGAGGIEVRRLASGVGSIEGCDGIVLTGGEDVHPRFYNKPEYLPYCYADDINEVRDEFEMRVLEYTEANGIPVLGICRGLQLANVSFGGTLIPDIPSWGKFSHGKLADGSDRNHSVQVDVDSWLHGITGASTGFINSNHHQSADRIGRGLVASALSPDGVIEALERSAPGSFLCLVQWHPERMRDQNNPLTKNIRRAFLEAAQIKSLTHANH
jgi:putative glutamine amidotransferase